MEIRQARGEELPELKQHLKDSGGEEIDLDLARCWVAVEGGRIVGMLPVRLMWQMEPLLLFEGSKTQRSKAGLLMYRAACEWLADRGQNRTGIHWFFAVTRSERVKKWAERLGWFRQYRGSAMFIKHL